MAYISWADVEKMKSEKDADIAKLRAELLQVSKLANDRGKEISFLKDMMGPEIITIEAALADQEKRIIEAVKEVWLRDRCCWEDVIAAIKEATDGK